MAFAGNTFLGKELFIMKKLIWIVVALVAVLALFVFFTADADAATMPAPVVQPGGSNEVALPNGTRLGVSWDSYRYKAEDALAETFSSGMSFSVRTRYEITYISSYFAPGWRDGGPDYTRWQYTAYVNGIVRTGVAQQSSGGSVYYTLGDTSVSKYQSTDSWRYLDGKLENYAHASMTISHQGSSLGSFDYGSAHYYEYDVFEDGGGGKGSVGISEVSIAPLYERWSVDYYGTYEFATAAEGVRFALASGYEVSAVPEPATLGLLPIAGLAFARRRRA